MKDSIQAIPKLKPFNYDKQPVRKSASMFKLSDLSHLAKSLSNKSDFESIKIDYK